MVEPPRPGGGDPVKSRLIGIALACLLFSSGFLRAEEVKPVLVQESESVAGKILLAPLAIPPFLVRVASYPLVKFADFSERVDLAGRTLDFFSNDSRTAFWYPTFRLGGTGGFFFGLGAFHRDLFGRGYRASALAQVSPELDQEMSASATNPSIGGTGVFGGFSLKWKRRQDDSFFGIGNDTPDSGLNYEGRRLIAEIPIGGELVPRFGWEIFGQYIDLNTEESSDPALSLSANFGAAQTAGLGERITGAEFGLRLKLDMRSPRGTPGSGTAAGISFSRFEGSNSFDFFRTQVKVSQYFTLFLPGRVLAIGAKWEFVSTPGDEVVPFPLLPSLGGSSNLRGFEGSRFRERASLLLVGEYRYPVFQWIDGLLFLEGGRVGDGPGSLHPSGLHLSYGGGLRFRTADHFFFQIQGAGSSDGARFVFSFNQSL